MGLRLEETPPLGRERLRLGWGFKETPRALGGATTEKGPETRDFSGAQKGGVAASGVAPKGGPATQPKASRCLLKRSANRLLIQLDSYMPQSDLSPYRDLLNLQRRQKHRKCQWGFQKTPRAGWGAREAAAGVALASTPLAGGSSFAPPFTQKLCALKRFQLTKQPAFQHSFVRLDIIRKECLSFHFCSFEAPSLRYGLASRRDGFLRNPQGGLRPLKHRPENLVNPRNWGNQIASGHRFLPKPKHSFSSDDTSLLSQSLQGLRPFPFFYGSVGSLTLRDLVLRRSPLILRPTRDLRSPVVSAIEDKGVRGFQSLQPWEGSGNTPQIGAPH